MNLPNKLTISRFILTVAFLAVMFSQVKFHKTIALALFVAAGVSDFLDGEIARRHKLITNFGILMDPLADKIMVCSAFHRLCRAELDAGVDGGGGRGARTGHHGVAAAGRVQERRAGGGGLRQTQDRFAQMVAIIAILVLASYNEWGAGGPRDLWLPLSRPDDPGLQWFAGLAKWVAVALTFTLGVAVPLAEPRSFISRTCEALDRARLRRRAHSAWRRGRSGRWWARCGSGSCWGRATCGCSPPGPSPPLPSPFGCVVRRRKPWGKLTRVRSCWMKSRRCPFASRGWAAILVWKTGATARGRPTSFHCADLAAVAGGFWRLPLVRCRQALAGASEPVVARRLGRDDG
jgi:phosphatidylglycerophosphate synthase